MAKSPKKTGTAPEINRATVSIRNVDKDRWKAVQDKARKEGRFVWSVLDDIFDRYLGSQEKS